MAHIERLDSTLNIGPRGIRVGTPGTCSRKWTEVVGHLHLCRQHARLARQGFVDKDGEVANIGVRTDYARMLKRRKPEGAFFKWLPGADPRND